MVMFLRIRTTFPMKLNSCQKEDLGKQCSVCVLLVFVSVFSSTVMRRRDFSQITGRSETTVSEVASKLDFLYRNQWRVCVVLEVSVYFYTLYGITILYQDVLHVIRTLVWYLLSFTLQILTETIVCFVCLMCFQSHYLISISILSTEKF